MLKFEQTRKGLREFIQFLKGKGPGHVIYTILDDPITEEGEGQYISQGIDFENYKKKVNRYIEENKNNIAIYKLTHNQPLTSAELAGLQDVFLKKLSEQLLQALSIART